MDSHAEIGMDSNIQKHKRRIAVLQIYIKEEVSKEEGHRTGTFHGPWGRAGQGEIKRGQGDTMGFRVIGIPLEERDRLSLGVWGWTDLCRLHLKKKI
ncbi:hypothetical protein AB205_0072660 [Aquarana catesbeiana]|uniref:Uncharacterized protein n=1 Tax=Aquarana catesbeiana TaxID=8400 RepID=A0A2G9RDV4_AQUCT|nr:hypothetical protein AB205_0072660 [Aquarana catesbeiana]